VTFSSAGAFLAYLYRMYSSIQTSPGRHAQDPATVRVHQGRTEAKSSTYHLFLEGPLTICSLNEFISIPRKFCSDSASDEAICYQEAP
jgi:hypothetical protein